MLKITGARENNLRNIDVNIPHRSLTVVTGPSGSGKSSLAFNTIHAEGQRRYAETFSSYARNFLGASERPDVDSITGLGPVISIEQKTTVHNPRSTVGTTTEIYDFLRLLYARAATAYSYATGEKMVRYTEERVVEMILSDYNAHAIYLLAPLVRMRKGHYRELFESLRRKGYLYVRVDGELLEISRGMKTDRYKNHNIEVVVDKLAVDEKDRRRLKSSVATAMKLGDGLIMVMDKTTGQAKFYSKRLMCPTTGMAYPDPAPNIFSFNSPEGACPRCKGLGQVSMIDIDKVIPDRSLSIYDGGISPLGKYKNLMIFWQIEALLDKYGLKLKTPISQLPDEALSEILYGSLDDVRVSKEKVHTSSDYFLPYDGIVKYMQATIDSDGSAEARKWGDQFFAACTCPECHGARLRRESLSYRLLDKDISQLSAMDISEFRQWIAALPDKLDERQGRVAREIDKEILSRADFLIDVGLDYLSLNRPSTSLSGGESQRIRLATQIGSGLVNVMYILDEPSIGLHPRDNCRLTSTLKTLRDMGNTVIVVEHDREMMLAADWLVDIGPGAGVRGGRVMFEGRPQQLLLPRQSQSAIESITGDYLRGERQIPIPPRRSSAGCQWLTIKGARGNNLKSITASFPLGRFTVVTGVSGSGKSTLVNETLQPILSQHFYRSLQPPLAYDEVEGLGLVDKVVSVDQSPIGRTPRSNPATYTGLFADIRTLFASLPEAKIRGYKPGRFSFNVKGGRCEACSGNGYKNIEMGFLPDVMVACDVCHGKRYNRETLEVRFKGHSIADVLDMTVDAAVEFFENVPSILPKIKALRDVGLGYVKLGQSSTTLSGGESQRVKLATELGRKDTGRTVYILDEPTTGLHFEDIRILMGVLQRLVDKGNTVIVIEHNIDVIMQAEHIIDLGPEGGRRGGEIMATGTPEEVARQKNSATAPFIAAEIKNRKEQSPSAPKQEKE